MKDMKGLQKAIASALFLLFTVAPLAFVEAQDAEPTQPPVAQSAPADTGRQASGEVPRSSDAPPDTRTPPTSEVPPTDEEPPATEKPLPKESVAQRNVLAQKEGSDQASKITRQLVPQIDESTGALVYEFLLAVPPGRSGLTPDLTLRYNSQLQEDGVFGLGWSIDIPYIERLNKKGSDKLYSESYFASSIDGELVQVGSTTEYRAKIEDGTFLKYIFSSNTWTVTDKQGTVYKYGHQAATQQNDPNAASTVYRWFLGEVRDTNDNYIKYEYYKDSGEIYPSKITYTGNGTTDGIFQIEFLRESRADTLGVYPGAFLARTNYRISEIQAKVNGTWARKYELDYGSGDNANRSLLTVITESGQSETAVTVSYPANEFTYETSSKTMTSQSGAWGLPAYLVVDDVAKGYALAEVNGDGLVDLIFSQSGTGTTNKKVYLNTGSQWSYNSSWVVPDVSALTFEYGFTNALDVNADGLADLVLSVNNDGSSSTIVYLNTGSGWSSAGSWGIPTPFVGKSGTTITDFGFTFGDVNGDGLVDLLRADGSNRKVYINTGSQWSDDTTWTLPATFNFTNSMASAIDVNHDNLADIVWSATDSGTTNKKVYINTGHGWSYDSSWVVPGPFVEKSGSTITDFGFRLVDLNNDGFVDVVHAPTTTTKTAYINTGETWTQDAAWTFPTAATFTMKANRVRAADVDGDGLTDFVLSAQNSGTGSNLVYLNPGNKPDLVEIIENRNGGTITVEYKQTPLYTSGGSLLNPEYPFNLDTVSKITCNDGLGNTWFDSYVYEGADFYFTTYLERKFAGFSKVTMTDGLGTITRTFYHQGNGTNSAEGEYSDDISKLGRAYRVETRNSSNSLFQLQLSRWENYTLGNGANFVKNTQVMQLDYDGDADHRDRAESYAYNDTNGNLTQKIEWGEVLGAPDGTFSDTGADKFTTAVSYATNASAYILSRPFQELVTNQCDTKVKESRFYYDGLALGSVTDGNLTKREEWVTGWSYVDFERTYDSTYGTVLTEKDPRDKTTTYAYDSYNLYPATVTDPLSHAVSYTYDYSSGQVKTRTDENNRVFETVYDGFDRPIEEKAPNLASPASLVTKATYQYTDNTVPARIKQTNVLDATVSADLYKYFDGFGRLIQQRAEAETATQFAVTDYVYNDGELLEKETVPYFSTGSSRTLANADASLYIGYSYDAVDRRLAVTNVLGTTAFAYDQWRTTATDAESNVKEFARDAYDNLAEVVEHNGSSVYTTSYLYDYLKNLRKITDALGSVRAVTYDGLGRRTSLEDLHAPGDSAFGTWSFVYDDAGNLLARVDPKSQIVQYTYDDINRPLTENYTGAAGTEVTYSYDSCTEGVGRLCVATTTSAVSRYYYNAVGGIAKEAKVIDGTTYETEYSYDRQGNITNLIYPDDSEVRTVYNTAGQRETVEQKEVVGSYGFIISDFDYSPAGKVTRQTHGNGIVTIRSYDTLHRLTRILTDADLEEGSSCPAAIASSSLAANLVSYWKLNETSGSRADAHGLNTLADGNTVLYAPGKISNGADFERSNAEYLTITDGAQSGLDITNDMSMAFWVSVESAYAANYTPIGKADNTTGAGYRTSLFSDGSVYAFFRDASGNLSTGRTNGSVIPTNGTLKHVVVTFDADATTTNKVAIYVDGAIQTLGSILNNASTIADVAKNFSLGSLYDGGTHNESDGIIDEAGVWSRVLTQDEVNCLYNSGNGIPYTGASELVAEEQAATVDAVPLSVSDPTTDAGARLPIATLIEAKPADERATIKGREIAARVEKRQQVTRKQYTIEVLDVEAIDGGIQVFARAWDTNGQQIGFGPDGTVDIERFRFFNPPILVPDGTYRDEEVEKLGGGTETIKSPNYEEDPEEALLQVLEQAIATVGKSEGTIVKDKVGRTTSIFYPDGNPETSSVDGWTERDITSSPASWSSIRSGNGTVALDDDVTRYILAVVAAGSSNNFAENRRGILAFNTAAIPDTDVVNFATLSFIVNIKGDHDPTYEHFANITGATTASNTAVVASDYQSQLAHSTKFSTSKSIKNDITANGSTYTDWILNFAGRSNVNRTGVSKFGVKFDEDIDNTAFSWVSGTNFGLSVRLAETSGTTQDPKLVVEHSVPSSTLQDIRYVYDDVGNITEIADYSGTGTAKVVAFGYDDLYRLTAASTASAASTPFSQTYAYDPLGNMTSKSDVGSYTYAGTGYANPHAATSIAGTALGYDNDGNVVSYGSTTYSWDYRNRLVSLTASSTTATYSYDHTTERVKKVVGAATSIYPNDYYAVKGATTTKFIYGGEDLIATVDRVGSATNVYHVHNDHLGGTNVVTNGAGNVTQALDYYPYGSVRIDTGTDVSDREFIGELLDEESGLGYLNARYYAASRGQFLSQDPVFWEVGLNTQESVVALSNPQLQNSYAYAGNNPIGERDPNGRLIDTLVDLGFIVYDIYRVGDAYFNGGNVKAELGYLALDVAGAAAPFATGFGVVARTSKVANNLSDLNRIPDSALCVRGGLCTPESFIKGNSGPLKNGEVTAISVNSKPNVGVKGLSEGLPYSKVGVTTVGDVRKAGGNVVSSPSRNNPNHATLSGLTPSQASSLFKALKNLSKALSDYSKSLKKRR